MKEQIRSGERTDNDGAQSATEPEEAKKRQENAAPKSYDEGYELLVAELFAQYDPQTALEDQAIVRMAVAMWKNKSQLKSTAATDRALEEQIMMALARLTKSKALHRSADLVTDAISSRGRVRRNRVAQMSGRATARGREPTSRSWRQALETWTRPGEGGSPPAPEPPSPSINILAQYARERGITLK
jgi:hypothetical protein